MNNRNAVILFLSIITIASYALLSFLSDKENQDKTTRQHIPDYYMEYFSSTTMDLEGKPKNTLSAEYMTHFADKDTIELTKPILEIYKTNKPPMVLTSDKALITDNEEIILLMGTVNLWQDNNKGKRELEVVTSQVRVLLKEDYAETSEHAKIKSANTTINSVGVKAYFKNDRIELLSQVHGKIEPNKTL